ncbi:hypothetical protein VCHA53O473_130127 [Vibrio chagasii]|nr:hypothetical protein VCHA53O473_130127 [Vibrio chagasii]CAH7190662.1 hypothetical protein VCHA43P275_20334 [Vibrio chagasii]
MEAIHLLIGVSWGRKTVNENIFVMTAGTLFIEQLGHNPIQLNSNEPLSKSVFHTCSLCCDHQAILSYLNY